MSLGAALPREAVAPGRRAALRLALMAGAVLAAALVVAGSAWLLAPGIAPPPRSPFGMGLREAAPAATGLAGRLLALQASFAQGLHAAVAALKAQGAWGPLAALGFAYGVLHAAGPGHGKAVIAAYIVAGERALRRGCVLSLAAALVQALVAILIVVPGLLLLGATAASLNRAGSLVETAGFALVALVGLALAWRRAGRLADGVQGCGPDCGHVGPAQAASGSWRERLGVVLAAGARPCAGAVLVLVLAASQGVLTGGILAVMAMALGTALTTSALAALAVFAKRLALRLAGPGGRTGVLALGALELLAAALVLVLGLAMTGGLLLTPGA